MWGASVIGCQLTQETWVQSALDDTAGARGLADVAHHVIGGRVQLKRRGFKVLWMSGPGGRCCSPHHSPWDVIQLEQQGFEMRVDDVAGDIWQALSWGSG